MERSKTPHSKTRRNSNVRFSLQPSQVLVQASPMINPNLSDPRFEPENIPSNVQEVVSSSDGIDGLSKTPHYKTRRNSNVQFSLQPSQVLVQASPMMNPNLISDPRFEPESIPSNVQEVVSSSDVINGSGTTAYKTPGKTSLRRVMIQSKVPTKLESVHAAPTFKTPKISVKRQMDEAKVNRKILKRWNECCGMPVQILQDTQSGNPTQRTCCLCKSRTSYKCLGCHSWFCMKTHPESMDSGVKYIEVSSGKNSMEKGVGKEYFIESCFYKKHLQAWTASMGEVGK